MVLQPPIKAAILILLTVDYLLMVEMLILNQRTTIIIAAQIQVLLLIL